MNINHIEQYKARFFNDAVAFCEKKMGNITTETDQKQLSKDASKQTDDEKNDYQLAENLLFLLQLYHITSNETYLKKTRAVVEGYVREISGGGKHLMHLWIARAASELYQITGDQIYLDHALSIIRFEEAAVNTRHAPEQIIARNLLILINLYSLSGNGEILLTINLSVIKLLNYSFINKKGIYWPFLYRTISKFRASEKNLLELVFFTLHKAFKNDTFLYIANNIYLNKGRSTSKASGAYFEENPLNEYLGVCGTDLHEITLFSLSELSKLPEITKVNVKLAVPIVVKKAKTRFRTKKIFSKKPEVFNAFVAGVIYYYSYTFSHDDELLLLSEKKIHEIIFHLYSSVNSNGKKQLFNIPVLTRFILKVLFSNKLCPNTQFVYVGKPSKTDDTHNYPAITLSDIELRELIISNRFSKTMTVLREEIPIELNQYLSVTPERHPNANEDFVSNVRGWLKSDAKLKRNLNRIFKLELAGHRLMEKYTSVSPFQRPIYGYLSNSLDINSENFIKLKLMLCSDFRAIKIKLNPIIKAYIFTFRQQFINTTDCLIVIYYNVSRNLTEELLVDELDVIILNIFRKENIIERILEHTLNNIEHNSEQVKGIKTLIIQRIQRFIYQGVLVII